MGNSGWLSGTPSLTRGYLRVKYWGIRFAALGDTRSVTPCYNLKQSDTLGVDENVSGDRSNRVPDGERSLDLKQQTQEGRATTVEISQIRSFP